MPKRPRKHRLEDESRTAFEQAIPENWLFRPESSDYGIDGNVEVFDQSDETTGLRFHVQLKATDKALSDPPKIRIRRDTGEYYNTLELPVLMVLYHSPSNRLFVRWFHQFDPYYGGLGEKWITFKFPDGCEWNDQSGESVEITLRQLRVINSPALSNPVHVAVQVADGVFSDLSSAEVVSRLRAAAGLVPDHISIVRESDARRVVLVQLDAERIAVIVAGATRVTFHLRGEKPNLEHLGFDILLLIATALDHEGHPHTAAEIALAATENCSLLSDPMFLAEVTRCLVRAHRVPELLDVFRRYRVIEMDSPLPAFLESSAVLASSIKSQEQLAPFADYIISEIDDARIAGNTVRAALMNYNLGNLSRRISIGKALHHYKEAARLEEKYWKRGYFCQELAGVLFELHRYVCSTKLYRMALSLEGQIEIHALLADSLMHEGRYAEAIQEFEAYSQAAEETAAEWCLKGLMLREFVSWSDLETQTRKPRSALKLVASKEDLDESTMIEAINEDGLCSEAWFRLGLLKHREGDDAEAFFAFLTCALVDRQNLDAWCNAFGLVFKGVDNWEYFLVHILEVAYSAAGERFVAALSDYVASQGESFPATKVMNAVGGFLEERRAAVKKDPRKLRFWGPGQEIEEIEFPNPR